MKWLVQEFLNNGSNIERIKKALDFFFVDYLLIKLDSEDNLIVLDKESKLPFDNSDQILNDFILNEDIMVYGSKSFCNIALEMGLTPGSFMNKNFEFEVFREYLGDELLNSSFEIGELLNLTPVYDEFFIRPTGNTKLFTGMTVTRDEFLLWQDRERVEDSSYIGESLMISPVKEILVEYRFFIVNQEIVTGSSYKVGNSIDIYHPFSDELLSYTERMVDLFSLSVAYVIDIALTSEGFKVIEYNNFNSSGLYGCDEFEIVKAINNL